MLMLLYYFKIKRQPHNSFKTKIKAEKLSDDLESHGCNAEIFLVMAGFLAI